MKKYIVGFLAGAVFTLSATAFADTIPSLIGKKVQAQYTVEVNGKVLNTVVVDGSNYAPVRSFSEAAGFNITTEGKKVILNEVNSVNGININPKPTKEQLELALKKAQESVDQYTLAVNTSEEALKKETDQTRIDQFAPLLKMYKEQLAAAQAKLTDLQAQLAELQQ